jgi:hypothetical protein
MQETAAASDGSLTGSCYWLTFIHALHHHVIGQGVSRVQQLLVGGGTGHQQAVLVACDPSWCQDVGVRKGPKCSDDAPAHIRPMIRVPATDVRTMGIVSASSDSNTE